MTKNGKKDKKGKKSGKKCQMAKKTKNGMKWLKNATASFIYA